MRITEKCVVALRFRMRNSKGEVLENIMNGPPIYYISGSGKILKALELELLGMQAGQEKTIPITETDGYEGLDDKFLVEVVVDEVRQATEEELLHGIEMQRMASDDCDANCICNR